MKNAFFVTVALLLLLTSSFGQTPLDDDSKGLKQFGAYSSTGFDDINLQNGTLTVTLPFWDLPQRGDLKLGFSLRFNSDNYGKEWFYPENEAPWAYYSGGPAGIIPLAGNSYAFSVDGFIDPNGTPWTFVRVSDLSNSKHTMGRVGTDTQAFGGDYRSLDGSGLYLTSWRIIPPYSYTWDRLIDRQGITYFLNNQVGIIQQDRNGNQLKVSDTGTPGTENYTHTLTDTLGKNILLYSGNSLAHSTIGSPEPDTTSCRGPLPIAYARRLDLPGYGGTASFVFCLVRISYQTAFPDATEQATGAADVVQSITQADGTSWIFEYQDDDGMPGVNYGNLTKITFPTGGTVTYQYQFVPRAFANDGGVVRGVYLRTVDAGDGTGPHSTTYHYYDTVTGAFVWQFSTRVTAPQMPYDSTPNETVHTFQDYFCSSAPGTAYEIKSEIFQGLKSSGLKLQTTETNYYCNQYLDTGLLFPAVNVVPSSVTTTTDDGTKSQVTTNFTSATFQWTGYPAHGIGAGIYGPVFDVRQYDYGPGAPGPMLNRQNKTYRWQTSSAYLSANLLDLPSAAITYDGSNIRAAETDYTYDESAYLTASGITTSHINPSNVRGNLSTVSRWLNTGNPVVTHTNWFDTGVPYQSKDALNNTKTFSYGSAYKGAFLTGTQDPLGHSVAAEYDFNTGKMTSYTDQNNQTTTYEYDGMLRLRRLVYPTGGGEKTIIYSPSGFPIFADSMKTLDSSRTLSEHVIFDGFGRRKQHQITSDPQGTDYLDFSYDPLGREFSVSNAYRIPNDISHGDTTGNTSTTYDALGRIRTSIRQDGAQVTSTYTGSCVTVTDESSKTRKHCSDALGRVISVKEGPSEYPTMYRYDSLGNITCVEQHGNSATGTSCSAGRAAFNPSTNSWRVRLQFYDSLSRLIESDNPESGVSTFSYDANGNLISRTDAAGHFVFFCYDAENRLVGKKYGSATACPGGAFDVKYTFDSADSYFSGQVFPVHRRTKMVDQAGSTIWAYDQMGRALEERRTTTAVVNGSIQSWTKYVRRAYNLDSTVSSIEYPSGNTVSYTFDPVGRPITATSTDPNTGQTANLISQVQYLANNAIAEEVLGSVPGGFGGVRGSFSFNSRIQPWHLLFSTASHDHADLTSPTCTNVTGDLMHRVYSFFDGSGNNGNLGRATNCLDSNKTQNFSYDALNRITAAYTDGPNWGEQYTIDPWGNLTNIAGYQGKVSYEPLNAPANYKNQLTGFGYDASGNVLTDTQGHGVVYDDESRISSVGGTVSYTYDGDGARTVKSIQQQSGTVYWGGSGSPVLAESGFEGTVNSEYVYFGSKRVARIDNPGQSGQQVRYYVSDYLDSTSLIFDSSGSTVRTYDYYPYGGEVNSTGSDPNHYKFAGKERDSETGFDYFGARYYGSNVARFGIPDPVSLKIDRLLDPQRLNLYSYVRNSPLQFTDPSGRDLLAGAGDQKAVKNALIEIARTPQGRRFLQTLDSWSLPIRISEGKVPGDNYGNGTPATFRPVVQNGKIVDVVGPTFEVTVDFKRAKSDREENAAGNETGVGPRWKNTPKSDAEQIGHELEHIDDKANGNPQGGDKNETQMTDLADKLLENPDKSSKDKELRSWVEELLKPKDTKRNPDECVNQACQH